MWAIIGQFTVDADNPDEAIAWLKAEVAMKLQPGAGCDREWDRPSPARSRPAFHRAGRR